MLVVIGAGCGAFSYRMTYFVWPGQAAGARMHWCGRDYDGSNGPRVTLAVATAATGSTPELRGSYPPLGRRQDVFATQPLAQPDVSHKLCPTTLYLRDGSGLYRVYGLLGGN